MKRSMKQETSQRSRKIQITCKKRDRCGRRVPHISHQATPLIPENHTLDDNAVNAEDINSVLPDEILEQILAKLPITSITRLGTICNKWREIALATTFLKKFLDSPSRKSWCLMVTSLQRRGFVYDHALGKWCIFDIPSQIIAPMSPVASASGLICSLSKFESKKVYVYNPITKLCRRLVDRPTKKLSEVSGLSISVGKNLRSYTVAIMRSCGGEDLYKFAIDVYSSDKLSWETKEVVVQGWKSSFTCVICDGVLYNVLYSLDWGNPPALWAYDLTSASPKGNLIPFPCDLMSTKVMNIKGELVIATGVKKQSVYGIIIWLLKDKELVEVARAPEDYCREFSMAYSSGGFDETIYIWDGLTPYLLMFDMVSGQWSWTSRGPFITTEWWSRRGPSIGGEFFSGICFEPRFDTVP